MYVVRLKDRANETVWGPFAEGADAFAFARVLSGAVDPAEVVRLRSPLGEMASIYDWFAGELAARRDS